jgi:hypothetical protein
MHNPNFLLFKTCGGFHTQVLGPSMVRAPYSHFLPVILTQPRLNLTAGFHEDGFTSGLKAATTIPLSNLNVSLPFAIASPDRATDSVIVRKLGKQAFGAAESIRGLLSVVVWWFVGVVGLVGEPRKKVD